MTADVYAQSFNALGTTCSVLTTDERSTLITVEYVKGFVAQLDKACSRFRDDSDLSIVNSRASRWTSVSPLFISALREGVRAAEITNGIIDPTLGRTMYDIGYVSDFASISDGPLRVSLHRADAWRTISIDDVENRVKVPEGVLLDLGATAKAFAADEAASRAHEVLGAAVLVNLGGDIAMAGTAPDNGWLIGIADSHRVEAGDVDTVISVLGGGVATSSTTVRRWKREGHDVHHIVDPRTNQSASVVWKTVSVAAGACVDANIASTASIILGEDSLGWLSDKSLDARLVRPNGEVVTTGQWPIEVPA